jgi:hypothetical protein
MSQRNLKITCESAHMNRLIQYTGIRSSVVIGDSTGKN